MQPALTAPIPRPPDWPDGWSTGPPDYVGVGCAQSGTRWWHRLLRGHPAVAPLPATPAEIHFFDDLFETGLDADAIARYHAFFGRPDGDTIAGEWTPSYMLDAWGPPLLREAAPDARLLVLLRDPVECFRDGLTPEERPGDHSPTVRAAANALFSRGLYAAQLERLWRAFPAEQVLVLQYERCLAEPRAQLERTFAFLGLDPAPAATLDLVARDNDPTAGGGSLEPSQEAMLVRRYAAENERLAQRLPGFDLSLWQRPA